LLGGTAIVGSEGRSLALLRNPNCKGNFFRERSPPAWKRRRPKPAAPGLKTSVREPEDRATLTTKVGEGWERVYSLGLDKRPRPSFVSSEVGEQTLRSREEPWSQHRGRSNLTRHLGYLARGFLLPLGLML
jgi:hypothetical protein